MAARAPADLILNAVQLGDDLDDRLTAAYLDALRKGGWSGDDRLVRLGICASAVRYDWLTAFALEHAAADEQLDYGGARAANASARYADRAAALEMCAPWSDEAERLARTVAG